MWFFLHILACLIIFNSFIKKFSEKGGSKKIISYLFFSLNCLVKELILASNMLLLFSIFSCSIFFFNTPKAFLSFSTKVVFFEPLDIHSIPNDPTPE